MKKVKILYNFLFLIGITYTQTINSDSLVAHYKLSRDNYNAEENYFYDLSGNGNHAIPSDTFQLVEDHLGNPDGAMRFDGIKDFLDCGNDDKFNFNGNSFTISALIKLYPDYNRRHALFSNNSVNFTFSGIKREPGFYGNGIMERFYDDPNYIYDKFFLFTLVYDSIEQKLNIYKNGELTSTRYSKPIEQDGNNLLVGTYKNLDLYFEGNIVEFKIFNQKLNTFEVKKQFKYNIPEFIDWGFEEGYITKSIDGFPHLDYPFSVAEFGNNDQNSKSISIYKGNENFVPIQGNFCAQHLCTSKISRSELSIKDVYTFQNAKEANYGVATRNYGLTSNEEKWFSYWLLIPDDFEMIDGNNGKITQFMERHPATGAYSPWFYIELHNWSVYGGKDVFHTCVLFWDEDSEGKLASQIIYYNHSMDIPFKRNEWNHFVLHIKSMADTTGYVEGWINGNPIFTDNDTKIQPRLKAWKGSGSREFDTGYNYTTKIKNHKACGQNFSNIISNSGSDFRIGYYRGSKFSSTQAIYTDEIKVGSTAESIGFYPNNPISAPSSIKIVNQNLVFDETYNGESNLKKLIIKNTGTAEVNILNIFINDTTNFNLTSTEKSNIPPNDSTEIGILFRPIDKTKENTYMVIYTNDIIQDSILINIKGNGVYPPQLKINIPQR